MCGLVGNGVMEHDRCGSMLEYSIAEAIAFREEHRVVSSCYSLLPVFIRASSHCVLRYEDDD